MKTAALLAVSAVAALSLVSAAPSEDLITSLPGFNGTFPSEQYSGYLVGNATGTRHLHYWAVMSENDPATDPVVLWMNGGVSACARIPIEPSPRALLCPPPSAR